MHTVKRKRSITVLTEMGAAMSTLRMLLERHPARAGLVCALLRAGVNDEPLTVHDGGPLDQLRTLDALWSVVAPYYGDAYGGRMHTLAQAVERLLAVLDAEGVAAGRSSEYTPARPNVAQTRT